MIKYTAAQFREMSVPAIEAIIARRIYEAGMIFESLENAGMIVGNGYGIAQQLVDHSVKVFRERWKGVSHVYNSRDVTRKEGM